MKFAVSVLPSLDISSGQICSTSSSVISASGFSRSTWMMYLLPSCSMISSWALAARVQQLKKLPSNRVRSLFLVIIFVIWVQNYGKLSAKQKNLFFFLPKRSNFAIEMAKIQLSFEIKE